MNKKVILMVNSECNAPCKEKLCYIPYTGHREPEEAVNLVDELVAQGHNVIVAGSEPTLNIGYLPAYKKAGQKYLRTNGILISQKSELLEEIKKHGIQEIQTSLHFGIQENVKSVPEETVSKAIQESKKRELKVQISTTISKENYKDVLYMCSRAYELGADYIEFIRYVKSGRARVDSASETVGKEEREVFFELVGYARKLYGKDVLRIKIHGNFGPRNRSKGEELSKCNEYCPAGKDFFAVSPDNLVYGCPFLMEPQFAIGRLEGSKIKIDEDLLYKRLCSGKRNRCITDYLLR